MSHPFAPLHAPVTVKPQSMHGIHHPGASVHAGTDSDPELDEWIESNLRHHKLRRARVAALTKAAKPFTYEQAEVMLVIGTKMSTSVK